MQLRPVVGVAILLALAFSSAAQEQTQRAPFSFESRTDMVLVPVLVRRSGAHVGHLQKGDFILLQDGREQSIATFEEVIGGPVATQQRPPALPPNLFTNLLPDNSRPKRLTIIVVDTVTAPRLNQMEARQAILRFLAKLPEATDPIELIAMTRAGIRVIHDFTTSPATLRVAAEKLRTEREAAPSSLEATLQDLQSMQLTIQLQGEGSLTSLAPTAADAERLRLYAETEERAVNLQRRIAITQALEGLQQIASSFAALPGRKSLLWLSAGFPFAVSDSNRAEIGWFADQGDLQPLYRRTWNVLNNANVALYPVDVRGLEVLEPLEPNARPPAMSVGAAGPLLRSARIRSASSHEDTIDILKTFAEMTGGRAYYNRNDLERCFDEAVNDSASYYMLGYYLTPQTRRAGWRQLKVKVRVPGVEVRARNAVFVGADRSDRDAATAMQLALRSPLDYTALGIIVEVTGTSASMGPNPKKRVSLHITIPPSAGVVDTANANRVQIEYYGVALTAEGAIADGFHDTSEAYLKMETAQRVNRDGLLHNASLRLAPGSYTLRVVVRDQVRGAIGSISAPLTVR